MSYALIDDGSKFAAGRLLSALEASAQVELPSGKRVKVKTQSILLQFEAPTPTELLTQAQVQAAGVDLQLAWEFAGDEDFSFTSLAADYFGAHAGAVEQAAALLALHEAPHYFRRAGKGRFRRAPAEQLQAALLGIERKRQQQLQIDEWAQALQAGSCPPPVADELYRILFKPDKNGPHYKAVVLAARASGKGPLELLRYAGAITSPYQFHWRRFLLEHFPKGTGFAPVAEAWLQAARQRIEALPTAPDAVQAFSIDDSSTTEIDDALSVQGVGTGEVTLGIHIAAPGLALQREDALELAARDRMSTVYMPGYKLTMLPDAAVECFSLQAGRTCPALSLYLVLDEATLALQRSETKLERVFIAANLRHDQLDAQATAEALASAEAAKAAALPFPIELAFLFRLAQALKAQREVVRGKPETFNRPDYNFRLLPAPNAKSDAEPTKPEPTGDEQVEISLRRRGAPLDLIVAECMIVANSTWGGWLAQCGVPGIYRSQASLQPGVKVRMGTRPAPHAGIGVPQYTWSTSPLRRYCDLVNQWQLIACVRNGPTAALVAPFKPKDAALLAVIGGFDAAYAAYAEFQANLERYWALRALQQHGVSELTVTNMAQGRVRSDDWPLVFNLAGAEALPRGARLKARVVSMDLLNLELHAQFLARIDEVADSSADPQTETVDDEDEDPSGSTGLALAIDVNEPSTDEPEASRPTGQAQSN